MCSGRQQCAALALLDMVHDFEETGTDSSMKCMREQPARILYRVMRIDIDGRPKVGRKSSMLGVRVGPPSRTIDIRVTGGYVEPQVGGLSVVPDDPLRIAEEFRPPDLGGSGDDPVWWLSIDAVGGLLRYRADPRNPEEHGYIEPSARMTLEQFEAALIATRPNWQLYSAS